MFPSPTPYTTDNRTPPSAKAEGLTTHGDISAHGSMLIVVNRCYNDSIEILRSLRQ